MRRASYLYLMVGIMQATAVNGVLGVAVTFVIISGGIDLSVVGVANLSAVVAALILTHLAGPGLPPATAAMWLAFALSTSLLIGAVAGLLNGTLVAHFGLPPILATLGSGLVFTGFAWS